MVIDGGLFKTYMNSIIRDKMNMVIFPVLLIGLGFCFVDSSEICFRRDILGHVSYITCDEDCCGSLEDKYCCRKTEVGIIAGSVVSVVVFFGITVTLIKCCCCHRNERRGYVKVNEGPPNYGSTTHYDIPRTPSGPNITDHETFTEETNTECKRKLDDDKEVIVAVEVERANKDEPNLEEVVTGPTLIEEITEVNSDDNEIDVITGQTVAASSGNDLIVGTDFDGSENTIKTDRHTPTIIVTDTDSPSGRHAYVEIKTENNFGENYDFHSGTYQVTDDMDEEVISDSSPLLQQLHDQYSHEADVYVDKTKSKTILVTDLDSDITEEVEDFELSGDLGDNGLSDFTDSHGESVLPDLTISFGGESVASDVTVITKEESIISAESLLPDLIISEEENLSSKSLQKNDVEISMGNQNTSAEKVYVFDNPPAGAYVTSGPYPSNPVEAYSEDEPREEIIIDDGTNQPISAYTDNSRPYDPGPAGAYASPQPAGMAAYNQPYSGDPMDAYNQPRAYQPADAYNQPIDAYQDNQPYRNDGPMDAYKDNQPYGPESSEPYSSDPADAYAVSDDNPADAY